MTPSAKPAQVRPKRLRFGLLSLCVFTGVAGAALGWVGRSLLFHETFVAKCDYVQWQDQNGKRRGVLFHSRWREASGRRELIHLLVVPGGIGGYYLSTADDFDSRRDGCRKDGVSQFHLFNEGLAKDGALAPLTDTRRVWILTKERSLEPIPMTPVEIKTITLESLDDLPRSKLWQEKIGPVWERVRNPEWGG